jgi:hypothetical protein
VCCRVAVGFELVSTGQQTQDWRQEEGEHGSDEEEEKESQGGIPGSKAKSVEEPFGIDQLAEDERESRATWRTSSLSA